MKLPGCTEGKQEAYEDSDKDGKLRSRLGLRLFISIGVAVLATMIFFEYLAYLYVTMPAQRSGEFFLLHSIHTVVTLLVLLVIIYFIIARYVLKPIGKLLSALEEIEKGNFVTPLEIRSGDEFEFVAGRFNDVRLKLKEYVQRMVRVEKYNSAFAISRRVMNEIRVPCSSLKENMQLLHSLAEEGSLSLKLTGSLLMECSKIEDKLNELDRITLPEELQDEQRKS